MGKTKIYKESWARTPNAFFIGAMRTTDQRNAEVETANQQWIAARSAFHTAFTTLDEAYKRSLKSQTTKTIGDLDKVRDHLAYVIEKVANLWASKLDDDALNIHGRRVSQVFKDLTASLPVTTRPFMLAA